MRYATSADSMLAAIQSQKYRNKMIETNASLDDLRSTKDYNGVRQYSLRDFSDTKYPSWSGCGDNGGSDTPMTCEQIESVMQLLGKKFGFQADSISNMYDHLMVMLDSRSSRLRPQIALDSLHADYIGGEEANYRKWYFAAQMDCMDRDPEDIKQEIEENNNDEFAWLQSAETKWMNTMRGLDNETKIRDLALYLLLWGEAAAIRFTPEALCFIYKNARDYDKYSDDKDLTAYDKVKEGAYLDNVVTPFYRFFRDQTYENYDGRYVKREKDHDQTIGYDDVNQFFWHPKCFERIFIDDKKTTLASLPPHARYHALYQVDWQHVFKKTYKEKRSWMHASINFTRVWIIHIVSFWYYISANAPTMYLDPDPAIAYEESAVQWSVVGLGGVVAVLIMLIGSFAELTYLPMSWVSTKIITRRIGFLILLLIINAGPSFYCVFLDRTSLTSKLIALTQLLISIATTLFLVFTPSAYLFIGRDKRYRNNLAYRQFTANFPTLKPIDRIMSISLWVCVFSCKLLESYFFLALSFKDPLKVMSRMQIENCNDAVLNTLLCDYMPSITIVLMFLMDLILYFLDTYLWYIIWNTVFSVARSFYLGISIWSPWRNIFSRLPKRIFVKLLATTDIQIKYKPKVLCSQIWNAIVITMYREHLITADHVQRMLYQQEASSTDGRKTLKPPTFFVSQEDTAFKTEYFPKHSEAERRIHFFAQSLTTPMPPPRPVECMPSFTVLTPHYGEKILLTLREIIREDDQNSRVTLLEYLKQLHSAEWENFVKDTKIMADEELNEDINRSTSTFSEITEKGTAKAKVDDLPFYCIGFKSSKPEYTLRTRIWASLRAQTLYRTVSGFMNYRKAIRLLYRVENPDSVQGYREEHEQLEKDLDRLANRKFKFLVAMQRYAKFNATEAEDAEFLFSAYPDLQVAYVDEEEPAKDGVNNGESIFYSALVDGHCKKTENGKRIPKYRIRVPGNPILGDGKSDNQNHALIFYRGEFLQLVDANQDNYLEECLKIRNVLGEFENLDPIDHSPYSVAYNDNNNKKTSPVAIVGAREYIFSENIGVLGDVAAGKEQTFGTLTQRIMAKIGGKLHYGHPDFLNAIFMTTRGGVSKAQKGLHLNEDIYAGMNAFTRGGRIKHTEYFQCGKGRDLGFGSILNFTTKIGTGMGEQMLSREYYYIGTQLPLDRFLTFYYAHPGFHINNIFIMLSVQMFMYALLFIAAMGSTLVVCEYNADAPEDAPLSPAGCYNMVPIFEWVKRCILSIFVVFFVAFMPLFLQELTERGFWRSLTRLGRHFISLSPLFEIFVTQIYTNSVLDNLIFGGAQYIGTGRGFATSRIPFSVLYSRFSNSSIYSGARNLVIMLFVSLAVWIPHLIYFWFTVIALIISPFVFNPNQFALVDFLVDYREYIRWLSRGNSKSHKSSWINHCRLSRTRITGYKRRMKSSEVLGDIPRARMGTVFYSEILQPVLLAVLCIMPYVFVKSFDPDDNMQPSTGPSGLIRIGVLALAPVLLNAGALAIFFCISITLGSLFSLCCGKFGSVIAAMVHGWAVINLILIFEGLMLLEEWKPIFVVLGIVSIVAIQRCVLKILTVLFLTREFKHDGANRGWWTGKWYGHGLGWHAASQPLREFICKIVEMSEFATDFILGHCILFVLSLFCLIPCVNTAHSLMLFWLRPSKQIRPPIWTAKERKERYRISIVYGLLFVLMFVIFVTLLGAPLALAGSLTFVDPRSLPI
ncbi:1,3-beta-glucan synthase component-domain-containing protein [Halteromyces radiatus]|uniref:1,3-beta-glucan synthase component-domain-containing protein n=1 Tax=Halteromyces radiatus TaxID=101107 RepID=UPI00221ED360|nr:1,3-beta-glucan synthase component-domain-containing protein [Halteromyces radiatus]KAI8097579.1 1,3-beta-glucan synthase component-domain-containing protein [Halteromyces radiatus]